MNNINLVDEKICTGCGACYNICPKKAITMKPNEEGFLYPIINEDECIDCGLCLKSCAAYNPQYENSKEPECYAVWANDEIRMKSASGGAFTLLANYILDKGGYVCGAAWDNDFNVEHKIINKKEELHELQGVKYIQSSTKNTFKEIKSILSTGKLVLFVGTPCQVAGLKAFLQNKDYANLILVDLVCHGVPSPGVWQQYLEEKGFAGNISNIKFRNKRYGWSQSLEISLNNSIKYCGVPPIDTFYETFFILMNTRKSCGNCSFARITRQGDLTIGDAWNCQPSMNDNKGTSEILVNTPKGKDIFNKIKTKIYKYEKMDLNSAIKGNKALTKSFESHKFRTRFFQLLNRHSVKKSYNYAVNNTFDVALLGIWFYQNYGCVLTTFALGRVLQLMGYEVLLVDNSPMFSSDKLWRHGCIKITEFLNTFFDIKECKDKKGLQELNNQVHTFMVGSDQLFNWFLSLECGGYTYFLDFAHKDKKKIAYATSFGDGYCFFKKEYFDCKPLLQQFDAISVRENNYLDIIQQEFDIDATTNLDPVFLLDKNEYEKISALSKQKDGGGILAYILDMNEEKKKILKYLSQKLGKKIIVITDAETTKHKETLSYNVKETKSDIDVCDWLYYFKNADYIFTDSFHGVCFSIIFNKNFSCMMNIKRGVSRFLPILSILGLINRGFTDIQSMYNNDSLFEPIDYAKINSILKLKKEEALSWLSNSMSSSKYDKTSQRDFLLNKIFSLETSITKLQEQIKNIGKIFNE